MLEKYKPLVDQTYTHFNNRNVDGALLFMDPDVEWPNGWESGYVVGHEEVRDYWERQWKEMDPNVTPIAYRTLAGDKLEVEVLQSAKDFNGKMLFEGKVKHVYTFKDGLIKSMEVENEN